MLTRTDTDYLFATLTTSENRRKIAESYMECIKAYAYGRERPEKKLDDITLLIEKYDKEMKG